MTIKMRLRPVWISIPLVASFLVAPTFGQQVTHAQSELEMSVRRALERLPYYGVFDFLAFGVERGTVTLEGYAYRDSLRSEGETAVKRLSGIDEVANKIEVLPTSQNDDRIRWTTFYAIYTDDFLSRYAPGGAMRARYEALDLSRFPGMQPFGTYPIHIVVRNGRTTLLGIVDSEIDRRLAEVRTREVPQVFNVENDLVIRPRD
jgi:hyperosmotically inducible periplasmic protein